VRVGALRVALLAHFADLAQDVVVAGHDRDDVRILVFPNHAACRSLAAAAPDAPVRAVLGHASVIDRFTHALAAFASAQCGSSTRVEHAILLEQPPAIDAQEITDKGSLNQKAVLRHRQALVEQLYGAPGAGLLIDVSHRRVSA
jgi:feruloyl-CoA synthase